MAEAQVHFQGFVINQSIFYKVEFINKKKTEMYFSNPFTETYNFQNENRIVDLPDVLDSS